MLLFTKVVCFAFILHHFVHSSRQSEFEHFYRGGAINDDEDFKLLNVFSWADVHEDIPESFDARTAFPHCPSIAIIHDQGDCGSCWAVSGTDVINDRFCVISEGAAQVQLSAYDALNCCVYCLDEKHKDDICAGGSRNRLFAYFDSTGLVSGGPYQSNFGCIPYPIPPKDVANYTTHPPECRKQCSNQNYQTPYQNDIYAGAKSYSLDTEQDVQMDIMKRGPVSARMKLYDDFVILKNKVYIHNTNDTKIRTLHNVRIIGWGTENGIPYWLGANSWGTWWGMDGFFKIRRGTNEVDIEKNIAGIVPKLSFQ